MTWIQKIVYFRETYFKDQNSDTQIFELLVWTLGMTDRQLINLPEYPKTFHSVRKLSKFFEFFLDHLERFQSILKFSRVSQNFPKYLLRFQSVHKLSRQLINLPECLKTFQIVHKLSKISQTIQSVWKKFKSV